MTALGHPSEYNIPIYWLKFKYMMTDVNLSAEGEKEIKDMK